MKRLLALAERGRLPDAFIRRGIRMLNRRRLRRERRGGVEVQLARKMQLIAELRDSPVAVATDEANEQHYEVPPAFFQAVLGKRLKYSCCLWTPETPDLDAAEQAALAQIGDRAQLADGQDVLELGCGWGSLTLWMAERYPRSRITAVSNSAPQRQFIEGRLADRGLTNVTVVTADMNDFDAAGRFDRVVSIEMFEHMRNYRELLSRIAGWLKPAGRLFVHIFAHRELAYVFEAGGPADWMGRTFFTGGIMPSDDLLMHFQDDLVIEDRWRLSGEHYRRTAEAWLTNLDGRRDELLPVMRNVYGQTDTALWLQRWRIFFLACAELWGFRGGSEWWVSHYRFRRRETAGEAKA
jgi:cyclopropane-fatty-acyl-phospholipid synthase